MEMLTSQHFGRLAEMSDAPCVSLLMPTHRSGRETKQDPIRFKNLLKEAEEKLTALGQSEDARRQLEPLRQRVDDTSFWAHQREGLAAFCLPGETHLYGVPFSLPEDVVIGRHAYLVPLVPIVSEDLHFYVLALSPKRVRLLEGTRHTAKELDLPGWPENLPELAAYIEEEPQLQFHTRATPEAGDRTRRAMFHGHPGAEGSSERKQRLLEYCHLVDERLHKALGVTTAPLVLACDERLAPIYRDASDYGRIVEQPVAGNPDIAQAADLCNAAWTILEPQVTEAREKVLARYRQSAARGQVAERLDAVLPAAHEGRIDTLLVAADGQPRWGRYDPDQRRLDIHDQPDKDDEELVNLAMVTAYCQDGAVYSLPQSQMPEPVQAAAILRY